jgi:hypothetical protein
MKEDFIIEKTPDGKYWTSQYIGFDIKMIKSNSITMMMGKEYHSSEKELNDYINLFGLILNQLFKMVDGESNAKQIMSYYTKNIEAWSTGLVVGSDYYAEKQAQLLLTWFNKKKEEGKSFCEEFLSKLKVGRWKGYYNDYDKFCDYNRAYQLGYSENFPIPSLSSDLDNINKHLDNINKLLKTIK